MGLARAWACAAALLIGACGPIVAAPAPPTGAQIAFGGGPGGGRDACFTCHGFRGEGAGLAPRLAGLEAGYMQKQLRDYADGRRADPVMAAVVARLSDFDRQAVSEHYAALDKPAPLAAAAPVLYANGDRARGVRACASCHGGAGQGEGLANPALARQPYAYTVEQLNRFRDSRRRNDPRDQMGAAARPLREDEIAAIARYLEGR